VQRVLHSAHEPLPETWAALEAALRLLDPDNTEGIAGWREALSAQALADELGVTVTQAHDRLRGRMTWTDEERARLVRHMTARRVCS
jgi:hypothetical protein